MAFGLPIDEMLEKAFADGRKSAEEEIKELKQKNKDCHAAYEAVVGQFNHAIDERVKAEEELKLLKKKLEIYNKVAQIGER